MRPGPPMLCSGFTLWELMVTVTVAAVVAAIALPSYQPIVRAGRLTAQIYDFDAALNLARSEAVKRGTTVTVCPSTDQASCGASGTHWEQGWIVFVDTNNNQTVDTGEQILRAEKALTSGYTLRGTSATTLASYLTANSKGALNATGTFVLCQNSTLNPSRAILVNSAGRIAIAGDDNGVPSDASGSDITSCTP